MGPRLINGQRRLVDFVGSRRDAPWVWGGHDCALFAADAVLAVSGVDYAGWFRGRYDSASGALEALLEYTTLQRPRGQGDPLEIVLAGLMAEAGISEIKPENAGRGSVSIINVDIPPLGHPMGVIIGNGLVATAEDPGVAFHSIKHCLRTWET